MSYTGRGHGRFGSRATRTAGKLGVQPIDGQRLAELLGNTNTKEASDMITEHSGIAWARQQRESEEAERRARAVPPPSADEILAQFHLVGVRKETALSVVREARHLLAAYPGSRDAIALAGQFLARLENKYDGSLRDLLAGGHGVESLRRLVAALLAAEGR